MGEDGPLSQYDCVLIKQRNLDMGTDMYREGHVKTGHVLPHAPELPEPGEKPGAHPSLSPQREHSPANTVIPDFQPLELRDNRFLLFKPLSWWYFCYNSSRTLILAAGTKG